MLKHNEAACVYAHHVHDRFNCELTVYAGDGPFVQEFDHRQGHRAGIDRRIEELIAREYPDLKLEDEISAQQERVDPHQMFPFAAAAVESVKQSPKHHPEGDVLYHSLQYLNWPATRGPTTKNSAGALLHDGRAS